jgi:hypothetical protein
MDRGGAEEQAKQNGGHGCDDGDASEWKKVAELRAVVEAKDPAAKVPLRIIHLSSCSSTSCLLLSPPLSTDDSRDWLTLIMLIYLPNFISQHIA